MNHQYCFCEKKTLPNRVDISQLEDYRPSKQSAMKGNMCLTWLHHRFGTFVNRWLIEYDFYNHQRDVVDLVYAMSNCQGWVNSTSDEVIFRMEPFQQPKRKIAQKLLCRKLNELCAGTQSGKWFCYEVGENPS